MIVGGWYKHSLTWPKLSSFYLLKGQIVAQLGGSIGWSIVLYTKDFGFDFQLGHVQEATDWCFFFFLPLP